MYSDFGRNPEYHTSNGSSGRPSRFSISAATLGTSGELTISTSIWRTRASGISRFSSKRRAISVGAVGEYGSIFRAAKYVFCSVA